MALNPGTLRDISTEYNSPQCLDWHYSTTEGIHLTRVDPAALAQPGQPEMSGTTNVNCRFSHLLKTSHKIDLHTNIKGVYKT